MNKKANTFKPVWGFATDNGKIISRQTYLFTKAGPPRVSPKKYFVCHVHSKVTTSQRPGRPVNLIFFCFFLTFSPGGGINRDPETLTFSADGKRRESPARGAGSSLGKRTRGLSFLLQL